MRDTQSGRPSNEEMNALLVTYLNAMASTQLMFQLLAPFSDPFLFDTVCFEPETLLLAHQIGFTPAFQRALPSMQISAFREDLVGTQDPYLCPYPILLLVSAGESWHCRSCKASPPKSKSRPCDAKLAFHEYAWLGRK